MKLGSKLAIALLSAVIIAHVLRLVMHIEVTAGGIAVPSWASVVGIIVPAAVCLLLWRDSDPNSGP